MEGELFGYEAGAVREASSRRRGMIERAHGGTLLLDEIADLPFAVQPKIFRFLHDAEVTGSNGTDAVEVDVRVLATTSRNLETAVRRGDFLEDLFDALRLVTIEVPPLRERPQEIAILAQMFVRRYNLEFDRHLSLGPDTIRLLEAHDWPGNVRELMQLMRRLVMLNRGVIGADDFALGPAVPEPFAPLAGHPTAAPPKLLPLKEVARRAARDAERAVISDALARSRGNRAQAARLLRVS